MMWHIRIFNQHAPPRHPVLTATTDVCVCVCVCASVRL